MRIFLFVLALAGVLLSSTGYAQQLDAVHQDWNVFSVTQQGKKICYIASTPKQKTGNYKQRGEPYALVTHVSAAVDEASVSSGYPYKTGSEVQVVIDGKNYKFFTKGELAWAYDSRQDAQVVQAMKSGRSMVVKGTSMRGTYSNDSYSLRGFTDAYRRMKALCR